MDSTPGTNPVQRPGRPSPSTPQPTIQVCKEARHHLNGIGPRHEGHDHEPNRLLLAGHKSCALYKLRGESHEFYSSGVSNTCTTHLPS